MAPKGDKDKFLSSALRDIRDKWDDSWVQYHTERIPDIVYHYTDARGIVGIVQSNSLWASNAVFLNDASELIYLQNVVPAVIEELRTRYTDRHALSFITSFESWVPIVTSGPGNMAEPYVACFCADGDLLSQWRGYTPVGRGFAIGFRTTSLVTEPDFLRRVIYDEARQRQFLFALVTPACDAELPRRGRRTRSYRAGTRGGRSGSHQSLD